jgi:hypothetical protein
MGETPCPLHGAPTDHEVHMWESVLRGENTWNPCVLPRELAYLITHQFPNEKECDSVYIW